MDEFIKRRFMPRLEKKYGSLSDQEIGLIRCIELQFDLADINTCEILYRLVKHCNDIDEVRLSMSIRASGNIPADNSLAMYQYLYGKESGTLKYELARDANSKRTSVNTIFRDNHAIQSKAQAGIVRAKQADPLYDKKRNVFCIEYYHHRGIHDPFEIEQMMSVQRRKSALTKEQFIAKFGQDRWDDKMAAVRKGLSAAPRRCASKESMRFLRALTTQLDVDVRDIWWFDGLRGEWWIRNHSSDSYYFLDWCVPELKIAIEYHGRYFHPKSATDEVYETQRWGTMPNASVKYAYDVAKKHAIINQGYILFEVWSDELPDIKKLSEEINHAINSRRIELVPAV